MPLIEIPKDARAGKEPCGECHVSIGETCDICGAKHPVTLVICGAPCDHDFKGGREIDGGRGYEAVCANCGMGAMAWSLRTGI